MWFYLADSVLKCSVSEAKERISYPEYCLWKRFLEKGKSRSDWQSASIASEVYNCMTYGKKRQINEFLIEFKSNEDLEKLKQQRDEQYENRDKSIFGSKFKFVEERKNGS